ncbi:MAG: transcription elongation factor GreA [Anaerolineae bacterium]|jgi:transcription elongation factor GreA|uniref:transcription elongation factor GreA n=1 Tax=Candidatus Flexifilum breve TaxID=3140694 RepID=UPI001AC3C044|nr:transcription elongation factor GreA [Chloroflexota bacterium]MBK9751141.1 transcription elongation factor GreA [Chloroflexota bacterium]MBN8637240.1 transcription elongation factor GreA [Anaerolineae bacterium]
MTSENALTPEGYADLKRELDTLITVRRPELAKKLAEAVAEGDLKENANYHDAKEQQAFIEGRIKYLEHILRTATIIQREGKTDVVSLGSMVTIIEEGYDDEETYSIVGAAEANPAEGKISNLSPIGAALLGAKKGDKVRVKTPNGETVVKIKSIK